MRRFFVNVAFGALAVAWSIAGSATAQAQTEPRVGAPADLRLLSDSATSGFSIAPPAVDLESRVGELERALQKADEKAEEDRRRAAGKPSAAVHGRIFTDVAYFTQSPLNKTVYGNMVNGAGFRSARLAVEGKAFEITNYKVEIEFVGGIYDINGQTLLGDGIQYKDVYLGVSDLPYIGNVRVGHFKEPFCLEEQPDEQFVTFMERTMMNQLLVPSRNLGVMLFDYQEERRVLWQAGIFANNIPDTIPRRDNDDLGAAATGRLVWQPWYDEATDAGVLHLGAAYSYRQALTTAGVPEAIFRAKPNTDFGGNAAFVIQAGRPDLADWQIAGAELAFIYGPFSFQSEAIAGMLNPRNGADPEATIRGAYFELSYFLTGEHRNYVRKEGSFGRVKVAENFFRVRAEDESIYTGAGAWQLAYRYDYVDAMEAVWPTSKRELAGTNTFGLSWYLNPYTRCMFNWVHADCDRAGIGSTGWVDIAMMRVLVDF